jgi:hypothetical protein
MYFWRENQNKKSNKKKLYMVSCLNIQLNMSETLNPKPIHEVYFSLEKQSVGVTMGLKRTSGNFSLQQNSRFSNGSSLNDQFP